MVDNFRPPHVVGHGASGASGAQQTIYFCTHAHSGEGSSERARSDTERCVRAVSLSRFSRRCCDSVTLWFAVRPDHTVGLSASWDLGVIYCSALTKALLALEFGPALGSRLRALELEQAHIIVLQQAVATTAATAAAVDPQQQQQQQQTDDGWEGIEDEVKEDPAVNASSGAGAAGAAGAAGGAVASSFTVSLFPSNHCPGSVMFLFRSGSWGSILHTGDFRYCPRAFHSAALHEHVGRIDLMYFDATFLQPSCAFPTKQQAIEECVRAVKEIKQKHEAQSAAAIRGASAAASASTTPLHPSCDWRVYLSCECLGSEEVLDALYAEFKEPFFVDTSSPPPPAAHTTGSSAASGARGRPGGAAASSALSSSSSSASPALHGLGLGRRADQLRVLARAEGDFRCGHVLAPAPGATPASAHASLAVTTMAASTHFHLAPARAFAQLAQRDRIRRAEAKNAYLVAQAHAQAAAAAATATAAQRPGTGMGRGGAHNTFNMFDACNPLAPLPSSAPLSSAAASAATAAAAAHLLASAAAAPPPLTLYLKPSTQWFVLNQAGGRAMSFNMASGAAGGPGGGAGAALPLSSSWLGKGAVEYSDALARAHDSATQAQAQAQWSSAGAGGRPAVTMRGYDRWNVTHVLYSMHSDFAEIIDFVRFMRPTAICPINTPVGFEPQLHDGGGGGGGADSSLPFSLSQPNAPSATTTRNGGDSTLCRYGYGEAAMSLRGGGGGFGGGGGGGHDWVRQQALLAFVERCLRAGGLSPHETPLVRGTDFRPRAARSRLSLSAAGGAAATNSPSPSAAAAAAAGPLSVTGPPTPAAAGHNSAWEAMLKRGGRAATDRDHVVQGHAHRAPLPAPPAGGPLRDRAQSSPTKGSAGTGGGDPDRTMPDDRVHLPQEQQQQQPGEVGSGKRGSATGAQIAMPACKRVKLALAMPPSPLDRLGGGRLGATTTAAAGAAAVIAAASVVPRKRAAAGGTQSMVPAVCGSLAASLPPQRICYKVHFAPRRLQAATFFLERDVASLPDLRDELQHRLRKLGANVICWTPSSSSSSATKPALPLPLPPATAAAAGGGVGAATPAASVFPAGLGPGVSLGPPASTPLPAGIDFIVVCHRNPSFPKLLQYVIKKVHKARLRDEKAAAAAAAAAVAAASLAGGAAAVADPPPSPIREWAHRPLFICNLDCLFWFEAANGVYPDPDPDPDPEAAASRLLVPPRSGHLTWPDVCVWNSATLFEPNQPIALAVPTPAPTPALVD